jgi:hypothetical protein
VRGARTKTVTAMTETLERIERLLVAAQ